MKKLLFLAVFLVGCEKFDFKPTNKSYSLFIGNKLIYCKKSELVSGAYIVLTGCTDNMEIMNPVNVMREIK